MNMNIAERTRELGVLRAVGATPGTIVRLLLAEGMLMSGMSLLFAWLASLLFSALLGVVIGGMAFRTPLPLVIAWWGVLAWIVLLALVGVGATLYPAWRAGRMSTRAALAYQ
jgi:putative ABC transport system permease protein